MKTDYYEEVRLVRSKALRYALIAVGLLSLLLGIAGIFLPILPTTPFLLLSAACFSKASTRFYNWLLNNPVFGEYIHNWRSEKKMMPRHKMISIGLIIVTASISIIFFIPFLSLKIMVGLICFSISLFLLRIPTFAKLELKQVQLIVFDLDGTLVNTLPDIALNMNIVLKQNNLHSHRELSYRKFVGHGLKNLIEKVLPLTMRENRELAEKLYREVRDLYRQNLIKKSKPFKGILKMLKNFHQEGYKLAVFSNKSHDMTVKTIAQLFPDKLFDYVLGTNKVTALKPDPSGYLKICNDLNVPVENSLFVGDTEVDINMAHRANVAVIGVSWGYGSNAKLRKSGPAAIIHQPSELIKILKHANKNYLQGK